MLLYIFFLIFYHGQFQAYINKIVLRTPPPPMGPSPNFSSYQHSTMHITVFLVVNKFLGGLPNEPVLDGISL